MPSKGSDFTWQAHKNGELGPNKDGKSSFDQFRPFWKGWGSFIVRERCHKREMCSVSPTVQKVSVSIDHIRFAQFELDEGHYGLHVGFSCILSVCYRHIVIE